MENTFTSKINGVYDWLKKQQITFVDQDKKAYKKNNSHSTWDTYCNVMKTYEKWLQKEHGLKDITRAKPKHAEEYMQNLIDKYKRGEGSAYTLSKFPHALHSLQQSARDSKVYRGLKLGNKADLIAMKNGEGIQRKSSESKCLKANASDFDKVQNEIANSRSPQKEIIMNIHQIQRGVGCRIHEVVKMKGEDITFNSNGSATVYIKGKGGLERWVHVDDKKTIELLKEQTKDKKDGAYVFPLKNKEGNDKNLSSSMKLAKDVIRSAAERSGVDRDEKTYSTHSARKVYAQERMNAYASMSQEQLQKELTKRIRNYPIDKHGKNRLKEKVDSELQEKRNKITRDDKDEQKRLRKERDWTHKELCEFMVSIDTGHFRTNIMRYYCDYPKDK